MVVGELLSFQELVQIRLHQTLESDANFMLDNERESECTIDQTAGQKVTPEKNHASGFHSKRSLFRDIHEYLHTKETVMSSAADGNSSNLR